MCAIGEPELNPSVWAKHVPQELLHKIQRAGSVLLVGDVDADGVGSAVALARTLTALGKRAVAYSSGPPPIEIQPLLDPNEVASGSIDERFNLIVHIDQDGSRVEPAVKEAEARAQAVEVIDHHAVTPERSTISWIDTGADASALLVLGLIIRLTDGAKADLPQDEWKRILTPILAAIGSDTHGLNQSNTRPSTYGIVKYLLRHTTADLRAVMDAFDPFSAELKRAARDAIDVRIEGERPRRTGLFALDAAGFSKLVDGVVAEKGTASEEDAYHLVVSVVQSLIDEHGVDLSVALVERSDHIKVSTRSTSPDDAMVMARAFGGNGKPGEGGSAIRDASRSLKAESARAVRLLENWRSNRLEQVVRRWRAGNL